MADYGVVSSGFARKPLPVILAEIEASNIAVYGPNIIQTPQSPMGVLNGLFADMIAQIWELYEDVYQSYDPDQAEDIRLDTLARLRLITRMPNESDADLRRAITNAGVANTRDADFYRAVVNAAGVRYARIFTNDESVTDENGMDPHSVSVAVLGGDDAEIATIARQYIIPGITSFGNTRVSTIIEGFCRSIRIMRPAEIPIFLNLKVIKTNGLNGCPPPSNAAIAQALWSQFNTDATRPVNGQDITDHLIRTYVSCMFPNVEITQIKGAKTPDPTTNLPLVIDFNQIATLGLSAIKVEVA